MLFKVILLALPIWQAAPVRMIPADEPGVPLELTVTLKNATSGETIPGARVYLYQTDAKGLYSPDGSSAQEKPPRIATRIETDSDGRLRVLTIRPGGYPGGRVTEHIHYEIEADGFQRLVGEVLFEDDPRLDESTRRSAARRGWPIARPADDGHGGLRIAVELQLSPR